MTAAIARLRDRTDLVPLALPALVAAAFGVMAWAHRWLHEDGLINLRVIQNLLDGRGPVYNAGERVEAFTSPAQILLVSLGRVATFGLVPLESVVLVVGVTASVIGLFAAMRGAMHLWSADVPGRLAVPLGGLVFAAVPLTWDFATSGHEGSVGFMWIGLCWYGLARRVRERSVGLAPPVDQPRWLLVAIGSGMLVRPEFALFTASFVACWFWLHRGARGSRWRALAWMAGPTLAYQVFRMGYYGLVLPNTALAKLGGPLGASEGMYFVGAFVSPFRLWLPLLVLAGVLAMLLATARTDQRVLVAAILVPALANIAYLVSIGGDYVNGRLLVVPFFALVAPVAVVPAALFARADGHRSVPRLAGLALVVLWAAAAATTMRPPWAVTASSFLDAKYDAREVAIRKWVGHPPRTIEDYRDTFLAGPAKTLTAQYPAAGGDLLVLDDPFMGQTVALERGDGPVVASTTIGALGVVTGIDVRIVDRLALADPVASHMPVTGTTAGHLRKLPNAWVYARTGVIADEPSAQAAKALGCGDLRRLMVDTTGSFTPRRFLVNLVHAPGNTFLDIPSDPDDAVDTFC